METEVDVTRDSMRDVLGREMTVGPRRHDESGGGRTEAGITGPERFPGVPCVRCDGTLALVWKGGGPGSGSGRLARALHCDACGLHVQMRQAVQSNSEHWLPNPASARRITRGGYSYRTRLTEDERAQLVRTFHEAAMLAEGGAQPHTKDDVLASIPRALRVLRALACFPGDWGGAARDVLCPACGGRHEALSPCRLCMGFAYVPMRLARWYERQIAGLLGETDASTGPGQGIVGRFSYLAQAGRAGEEVRA